MEVRLEFRPDGALRAIVGGAASLWGNVFSIEIQENNRLVIGVMDSVNHLHELFNLASEADRISRAWVQLLHLFLSLRRRPLEVLDDDEGALILLDVPTALILSPTPELREVMFALLEAHNARHAVTPA